MKTFFASLLAISTATMFMTSCKKEAMPVSNQSESAPLTEDAAANSRTDGGFLSAPVYVLTKHGKDTVTYYQDGRLAEVRQSLFRYTQYTYGFNTVSAKTYWMNKLSQEIIYQLDVNTGRVFESEWNGYAYFNGVTVHTQKWLKYVYNANGRLVKMYNKLEPMERTEFKWGWEADASLVNVRWFGKDGVEVKRVEFGNVTVKTALRMQLPITELDAYLNVFGKPNKDLPAVEHHLYLTNGVVTNAGHYSLAYEMNNNDYPAVRHRYKLVASTPTELMESTPYAYKPAP